MESEHSEKWASFDAVLVDESEGSKSRLLHSQVTCSRRCCGRRALVAGLVFAFAINMLLTILALMLSLASLKIASDSSAEIEKLREKLQSQKELLATLLKSTKGFEATREETAVTKRARDSPGLGTEMDSNPGGAPVRVPSAVHTNSGKAGMNGGRGAGGSDGYGVGVGGGDRKNGAQGDGESRSTAIPNEGGKHTKSNAAPIQVCDCNDPNAGRKLFGCCCKRRANNTQIYNSTTIDRFGQVLQGRAAGHFVACTPSQKDLSENRPAGEMVAYNLFRSGSSGVFIGDEEPWSSFPASREAFQFEPLRATITIKQDGLYFIYAQVAHIQFSVSTLAVNGIDWLQCQKGQRTVDSQSLIGRESCNMFGVRPLLFGDKLVIYNGAAQAGPMVTQPHCTNFGIVKL